MKIIDLYKEILSAGCLYADKEGMISAKFEGSTSPYLIDGKRAVLPTKEHLQNSDWSNRIVFHPLCEYTLRGESKVLERFRNNINLRLNLTLGKIADGLLKIVVNQGLHKQLSPDQSVLLSAVKNADEKTYAAFASLIKDMGISNKAKSFVHLYLKKGGVVDGKKYSRAAIVNFPLHEELLKNTKQVFGVTIASAKHRESIKQLLEFILPGIDKPHYFDRGSESMIAPFLDCLMQGVLGIASRINDILDEYGQFIDNADELRYTDGWVETFENLEQLRNEIRMIPMQAGNEGSTATTEVQKQQAPQAPAALTTPSPMPVVPTPPPIQPTCYPPQYPQQPQMQAPAAPGLVKSPSGGIDFAASTRGNSQFAPAMMGYGYPGYPGYQQPLPPGPMTNRMGPPRWDRPDAMPQGYSQQGYPQQAYPGYPQQSPYPQQGYGRTGGI